MKNADENRSHSLETLKITHVQLRDFRNSSRIIKEIDSVKKKFPTAYISFVGLQRGYLPSSECVEDRFDIFREKLTTFSLPKNIIFQLIKYVEWMLRVFFRLKKLDPTIIHCHSLASLPVSVISKFFLKCILIYDAHELETERNGFSSTRKKVSRFLEKSLIKFVDNIIVVSPSIQKFYTEMYPRTKTRLIVNAPSLSDKGIPSHEASNIKKKIGITENEFLFIYIGGLVKGRGIKLCLDVFKNLESPYHILFLGYGFLEEEIKKVVAKKNNVHILPPVPHHEVVSTLKQADVLIRILDIFSLSYFYSLPNSVFQAEMAGIPYLVNKDCVDIVSFFSASSLCVPIKKDQNALYQWIMQYNRENFPKSEESINPLYTWEAYERELYNAYGIS